MAETYQKQNNSAEAQKHLLELLGIAIQEKDKPEQANAYLKLGLLYYQDGTIKKSVESL